MTKLFPTILITLNFLAAIVYLFDGDWRHFGYWLSAAVLNICVTY